MHRADEPDSRLPAGTDGSGAHHGRSRGSVYYLCDDNVVVPLSDGTVREALHDLRWRLEEILAGGPAAVIVDVAGLTRLSSVTVAALLWANRRCVTRGVRLDLSDPGGRLANQLRAAGLDTIWEIRTGPTPTRKAQGT